MAAFDVEMMSRSLIGGMEIGAFNREVRERQVAKFAGAIDPERLGELCGLAKLESLLKLEAIPVLFVDIFDGGQLRRLVDVQSKSGKSSLAVVTENFRRGATIRVRDIDKFDAQLGRFVKQVQRDFAAPSQINLYLTPPGQEGFAPHFDITDAFIVQCMGSKEWKICPDYSNKIELPLAETPWDPERFAPSGPAEEMTLRAGDVLYLPRGAMHAAFCTERESMHLTVSVAPLTFADLIAKALKLAAESDVALRRRVPWEMGSDDRGCAAISATAQELAAKLAQQIDAGALLKAQRDLLPGALRTEAETGASDGLQSAIAALVERARS